jgi:hypothetical protein
MPISITTLRIMALFARLSTNKTQLMSLSITISSVVILSVAFCIVILSVIIFSVIALNVIMLNVVRLSVVAPLRVNKRVKNEGKTIQGLELQNFLQS